MEPNVQLPCWYGDAYSPKIVPKFDSTFLDLRYPKSLVCCTVSVFIAKHHRPIPTPPQDQTSFNIVRHQLYGVGVIIGRDKRPVFSSKYIAAVVASPELKASLVNQQCVVYCFKCDLCDGLCRLYIPTLTPTRWWAQENNQGENATRIEKCFRILKKCCGKFDYLLFEMLFIEEVKPPLNKQSDAIKTVG